MLGGKFGGTIFANLRSHIYPGSRKTYTKYVSLTALIFGNVTNLNALFPLWCRPIFPNWSVSKIEKNRVQTANIALYYLNAWDRLWKGRLKQVMISFPA